PRSTPFPYTTLFRSQRAQQVAGEAFGMEADQHRLGRVDLADHDGEMLLAAVARPPGEDAGVLRALERHMRLRDLLQVARGGLLRSEEHTSELQSRGH